MRGLLALFATLSVAATVSANVTVRVIDTGPGLATAIRFPDGRIMVYDTGHWDYDDRQNGPTVTEAFQDFIGDADIDLLITSHSDSDHLAATDELFAEYRVHRVIRTGMTNEGATTWRNHRDAVEGAAEIGLTHDVNLAEVTLPFGTTYTFDGATVTYLVGFHEPPDDWGLHGSEFRNGNSIVVRLDYQGNSMLFMGDAVGRVEESPQDAAAIATERFLIDNRAERRIDVDVLIAPHHGSDDASSQEFIRHASPRWVIFSSGHQYDHPNDVTAQRFLSLNYTPECLLRTDLGDDEGNDEWDFGRQNGHDDDVLDDSIDILFPATGGGPQVGYVGGTPVDCPEVQMPQEDAPTPAVGQLVKKSRSGICHTIESTWYERTIHYELFPDLESCVASGGRPVGG